MSRKPCAAGLFYSDKVDELDKSVIDSFKSDFGPGSLPALKRDKEIKAIIAPHAGYPYSGPAAAFVYKEIAESRFPNVYIILGLSHQGYPSCISLENWDTPFGTVKNDNEFGRVFMANSGLKPNEKVNASEHSIEVQLPFLQFVSKDFIEQLRFFPITISHDRNLLEIAKAILKTAEQTRKKIIVIASSDFTHYGLNYGYYPFNNDIKENMYKLDKDAISFIEKVNPNGFSGYIEEKGATICGQKPIEALLNYAQLISIKKAKLLKYYTSGDMVGDYSSAVGYGAIVFD